MNFAYAYAKMLLGHHGITWLVGPSTEEAP
jgi:hypothetical protein